MSEERKYTGFAAIYQLEQEKLKREKAEPAEVRPAPASWPAGEPPPAPAPSEEAPAAADASHVGEAGARSETPDEAAPRAETAAGDSVRPIRPEPAKSPAAPRAPRRAPAAPAAPKAAAAPGPAGKSAEAHAVRWKQVYRLNKGEINVMKVMFALSHALGTDTCHIKVGEVAEAARLKKRRCQYVIRGLETLGFLERLGEYDPANRLGLKYRVYLRPARPDLE